MADLNKTFLIGRLCFDPELRRTSGGTAVTELRLVVNRSFKGRDGEKKDEVLYVDVTCWDRQAENVCQYLKKGSSVHVEGALKSESWNDKNTGEKRSKLGVTAERIQFLDGKQSSEQEPRQEPARPAAERQRSAPARKQAPVQPTDSKVMDDDEIPF